MLQSQPCLLCGSARRSSSIEIGRAAILVRQRRDTLWRHVRALSHAATHERVLAHHARRIAKLVLAYSGHPEVATAFHCEHMTKPRAHLVKKRPVRVVGRVVSHDAPLGGRCRCASKRHQTRVGRGRGRGDVLGGRRTRRSLRDLRGLLRCSTGRHACQHQDDASRRHSLSRRTSSSACASSRFSKKLIRDFFPSNV